MGRKLTQQGQNDRNGILQLSPAISLARNTYDALSSSSDQDLTLNDSAGLLRIICDSQIFLKVGNGAAVTASSSSYDHVIPAGIPYDIPLSELLPSSTISMIGDGASSNVRVIQY